MSRLREWILFTFIRHRFFDLKWPFQGNDMNCFDSNVRVCSSSSLTTRRGTRKLIYILAFILLKLLTTSPSTLKITTPTLPSSSIVAVLIAKAGHVWVNWPEEFLLYLLALTLQRASIKPGTWNIPELIPEHPGT